MLREWVWSASEGRWPVPPTLASEKERSATGHAPAGTTAGGVYGLLDAGLSLQSNEQGHVQRSRLPSECGADRRRREQAPGQDEGRPAPQGTPVGAGVRHRPRPSQPSSCTTRRLHGGAPARDGASHRSLLGGVGARSPQGRGSREQLAAQPGATGRSSSQRIQVTSSRIRVRLGHLRAGRSSAGQPAYLSSRTAFGVPALHTQPSRVMFTHTRAS